MRTRAIETGDRNIVGQALCEIRKNKCIKQKDALAMLRAEGIDINGSALSKLEGGHRAISDKELLVFSKVYKTPIADIYQIALLMKE